ncbi:MAG: hypothetical protein CMJ81_07615 [Planctomycetaceae bacterium]|nr:hypothetical protein [Planctomycetaceae bacterium]MBP61029.1 hypothetical protein [Planctomycetaceae bacterium]
MQLHTLLQQLTDFDTPLLANTIGSITIEAGDFLHATREGVIKIPTSCLEELPGRAVAMRAFEHAAHREMRRTDITVNAKRKLVFGPLTDYGF